LNSAGADAKGDDGTSAYAAIIAALRSLAPAWASELRDRRIRVNVISPDEEVASAALVLASGRSTPTADADIPVEGGIN